MQRRGWTTVVLALFVLEMVIPLVGLLVFSLQTPSGVSLSGYLSMVEDPTFRQSLVHSLVISLVSIALSVVLFTPPLWYAYMYRPKIVKWIEGASFLPFVLPGVVLGLGYVQFFSNPPLAWAGTPYLLPFAFALLGMPYYLQAVLNRLRLVDAKTYHDASSSLGASGFRSWWSIQLPLLRPGVVNGAILIFSISMGEFAITQLTTGGSYMTLPIYLQVTFQDNPIQGAAMAVLALVIAILAVFLSLMTVSGRKRGA
ncbi:ABC transporter permease [Alicyclobacillus sp. ALC3]|uniref:ABC transporter permease n=1 Tax=Alicyclobacillus sp. ALC3 TaxID=2796143 RepID=UPI002378F62F|nr:ABC transporter permease subunit [Alicyclobacillus sp. ALC3]WDL99096.1 ABC transporter permease subunit [Alicyclobacillus sp. ALC3]